MQEQYHLLISSPLLSTAMDAILFFISALSVILLIKFFLTSSSSSKKKRNLPPSPPFLPIIGHLHLLQKPLHRTLARLSDAHGPVLLFRFGYRPVLLVSSLSLAEECFTKNDLAFASRPRLPSIQHISYNYTTLASAPYGPHWRNLRRIAAIEVFSTVRLQASADARVDEVRCMAGQLFRDWRSGAGDGDQQYWRKVKLRPRLFGVALNVIMRIIAGKRYYGECYGEDAADAKETREFREMLEEALSVLGVSNPGDFLPILRLIDFRGVKNKMARAAEKTNRVLQGLIDEHRRKDSSSSYSSDDNSTKTMIGELLSMQQDNPEYYTDKNIKALILTFLFAGTDTSTETLDWAMSLLLNHPESLQKAKLEIDTNITDGRLLEEHDLPLLPYLQAVIHETLRLYPTTPLLVPHESHLDTVVGGYNIPRGTMLLVNVWDIHRDPKIWVDPHKFMPERFVGVENRTLPFGKGRRKCPGEGLAMRVVGLELGTLLQCFEWERNGVDSVDMAEAGSLVLSKANPLEAVYRPRHHMIGALSSL